MDGYMDEWTCAWGHGWKHGWKEREKRMNKWVVGRWMDWFNICWAPTRSQTLL